MVIYKNRRALKFVDGGLQAFEEQADMVAVDETVVCREGDVDHPSPVALHIFAPIDSGDGIVRILHAWIDECGGIEIWRTWAIDHIGNVAHSSKEGRLAGYGFWSGFNVLS